MNNQTRSMAAHLRQPATLATHHEPVDVLAVMDAAIEAARSRLKDAQTEGTAAAPAFRSSQLDGILQARAAIAELIEAASAAEFHLTREHRAPMTVDAADYVTEVERDRNKLRAALARVGG